MCSTSKYPPPLFFFLHRTEHRTGPYSRGLTIYNMSALPAQAKTNSPGSLSYHLPLENLVTGDARNNPRTFCIPSMCCSSTKQWFFLQKLTLGTKCNLLKMQPFFQKYNLLVLKAWYLVQSQKPNRKLRGVSERSSNALCESFLLSMISRFNAYLLYADRGI